MGAELNDLNRTTFFDDDYPNAYGYKDSKGNFIKVNKARGTVQIQHSSSSNLRVAPDGSMQIALSNGAYFTFSNSSAFELSIGKVKISGTPDGSLTIKADSSITIDTSDFYINADNVTMTKGASVGTGVSDKFSADSKIITVTDGIITSIE
jgi:hypothetical protein